MSLGTVGDGAPHPARASSPNERSRPRSRRAADRSPYLFIFPFFALFTVFQLIPMAWTVFSSFTEWDGLSAIEFVGLDNYKRLLNDPSFIDAFRNTLIYWLVGMLTIPISIGIALVLTSPQLRLPALAKTVAFLPYVTATVAIGLVFNIMFDTNAGVLNAVLDLVGLGPVEWTTSTQTSKVPVAFLFIWRHVPWYTLIVISGLLTISKDFYEAARIDGAGAWVQFRKITLPAIAPILVFCFINLTVDSWKIFTEPYIIQGPATSSVSIFQYMYSTAFNLFKFGYASAMGVTLAAILIAASVVQLVIMRRQRES